MGGRCRWCRRCTWRLWSRRICWRIWWIYLRSSGGMVGGRQLLPGRRRLRILRWIWWWGCMGRGRCRSSCCNDDLAACVFDLLSMLIRNFGVGDDHVDFAQVAESDEGLLAEFGGGGEKDYLLGLVHHCFFGLEGQVV